MQTSLPLVSKLGIVLLYSADELIGIAKRSTNKNNAQPIVKRKAIIEPQFTSLLGFSDGLL